MKKMMRLVSIEDWGFSDWVPKVGETLPCEDCGSDPDLYKVWYGTTEYKRLYRWRFEEVELGEGWRVP